jgi:adenylate cyclase
MNQGRQASRRLAAILVADIAGYGRLMGSEEEATLARLQALRERVLEPSISRHSGRVVKTTGDGFLAEFPSPVEAVRCAIAIQRGVEATELDEAETRRIRFRIGVNLGDILVDPNDADIYGDGVNIAARLETLAAPGGICISGAVREQIAGKVDVTIIDRGEQALKHVTRPVRIFQIELEAARAPPALPDKPWLAVLPFDNLSGDPEQGYFADGVVEDIITALSRLRWLFVIARNSSFVYRDRNALDGRQVARELGVRYLLQGSVRRSGGRIRIVGQLVDALSGTHLWADRVEGTLDDIFELQDRITTSVVGAIEPQLVLAEIDRARRKPPGSLDAYDLVLRAYPMVWALTQESSFEAIRLLEAAIEREPDYATALALASWAHAQPIIYLWATDLAHHTQRALEYARRAIASPGGSDDPSVLVFYSTALSLVSRDHEAAADSLAKALALDPNSAWGWNRSGWLHVYCDQPEIAIEHFQRALRLSPFDPMNSNLWVGVGSAHFVAGRYAQAAESIARGIRERPSLVWPYRTYASALAMAGRLDEARAAVSRLLQAMPGVTVAAVQSAVKVSPEVMSRFAEGLRRAGLPER